MTSKILAVFLVIGSASVTAFSAEKSKTPNKQTATKVTAEQRQNMAAIHEKMATCLRSDKAFDECQKEMMQSCREIMKSGGCR